MTAVCGCPRHCTGNASSHQLQVLKSTALPSGDHKTVAVYESAVTPAPSTTGHTEQWQVSNVGASRVPTCMPHMSSMESCTCMDSCRERPTVRLCVLYSSSCRCATPQSSAGGYAALSNNAHCSLLNHWLAISATKGLPHKVSTWHARAFKTRCRCLSAS